MNKKKTAPKMKQFDDSKLLVIDEAHGITTLKDSYLDVIMQMPLPGIVIFVHGVNSDGEWYDQTEEGLCAGLNDRLKRRDEQMMFPTPKGGQLTPVKYMAELTPDGFINTDREPDTFIDGTAHFSPVIRFRWGYKANAEELQNYGDSIYLNEQDYWGGGPFANGCTSLPDLWNEGLSANLFLWLQVQHLTPDNSRQVFSCPHRAYYVIAALRLAKLVAAIREAQADVPITMVCHSQGNMIGMAAAFLGDRLPNMHDKRGKVGRCVADTYVLCNPPYSLLESNFTEDWTQSHMSDAQGRTGRQTKQARIDTLKAFFDIIRRPVSPRQDAAEINRWMLNTNHQFDAAQDRERYGYGTPRHTCGRVTLYCNPHDQVISSTAIQGIGWRGLSAEEIRATNGQDIFCQRVFAQACWIGPNPAQPGTEAKRSYHFWNDHHGTGIPDSSWQFWHPPSPKAKYSLAKGIEASKRFGTVLTVGLAPLFVVAMWISGVRINALPPKRWEIPLDAPDPPEGFLPQSRRFGQTSTRFDEGHASPGQQRDRNRQRTPDDPYGTDTPIAQDKNDPDRPSSDAALGDSASEAQLRYEDHGRLRMQARREGLVEKNAKVIGEDKPDEASADYQAWRAKKIKSQLAATIDTNATDHSTIMTNGEHARKALAYDVAVGLCHIPPEKLNDLRIAADWRLASGLSKNDHMVELSQYFKRAKINGDLARDWIIQNEEAQMPSKIANSRENGRAQTVAGDKS